MAASHMLTPISPHLILFPLNVLERYPLNAMNQLLAAINNL